MRRWADFGDKLPLIYFGTSVGHWEDTLVVQSGGYHDTTLLDASGLPHSDELMLTALYADRGGQETAGHAGDAVLTFQHVPQGRI